MSIQNHDRRLRNGQPIIVVSGLPRYPGTVPIPDADRLFGWIEGLCATPHRRPGTPEGLQGEQWVARRFEELGLQDVSLVQRVACPGTDAAPAAAADWLAQPASCRAKLAFLPRQERGWAGEAGVATEGPQHPPVTHLAQHSRRVPKQDARSR